MNPGSVRGQGTYSKPLPVIYLGFQNVPFSRVQLLSVTNSLFIKFCLKSQVFPTSLTAR